MPVIDARHLSYDGRHLLFQVSQQFCDRRAFGHFGACGKLVPAITPATFVAVMNVVLLLVGFAFLGRRFGIRTVLPPSHVGIPVSV